MKNQRGEGGGGTRDKVKLLFTHFEKYRSSWSFHPIIFLEYTDMHWFLSTVVITCHLPHQYRKSFYINSYLKFRI